MKKLLLLLFVPLLSVAQTDSTHQSELAEKAINKFYNTNQIGGINKLLESGKITNNFIVGKLHGELAYYYESEIYQLKKKRRNYKNDSILIYKYCKKIDNLSSNFLTHIDVAIEKCSKCESSYRLQRYNFFTRMDFDQQFCSVSTAGPFDIDFGLDSSLLIKTDNYIFNNFDTTRLKIRDRSYLVDYSFIDYYYLTELGYKDDVQGFSIALELSKTKNNNWIGGDISIASLMTPFQQIKTSDGESFIVSPMLFELMIFGFKTNLDRDERINDYSFELFRLPAESFVTKLSHPFSITKFGFMNKKEEKKEWYWSPEFGVAYGGLSISYSYNLYFRKDIDWLEGNNHIFNIRYSKQID